MEKQRPDTREHPSRLPHSLFWAKTDRENDETYHAAILHLADTAVVFSALLSALPRTQRRRLHRLVRGLPPREARAFLCLVAASHDIGKLSPGFEGKWPPGLSRLKAVGYGFPRGSETNHSQVSFEFLTGYWQDLGFDEPSAEALASVASAHHGAFLGQSALGCVDDSAWKLAREETLRLLIESLSPALAALLLDRDAATNPHGISISLDDPSALMVLSGLISVADWHASNAEQFSLTVAIPPDLRDYLDYRAEIARRLIDRLHLRAPRKGTPDDDEGLASLVGLSQGKSLNGLQEASLRAAREASGPSLVIIEAPMGQGKTEAALLAHSVFSGRSPAGLYYGLPTQATSAAMFKRVNAYLAKLASEEPVESHRLYDASFLNEDYRSLRVALLPSSFLAEERSADGGVVATDWFGGHKRGLLAAHAIGTIDQSLLAVLRRRHFFVRLYGLAGKVVVLDEIHAYDRYMRELIKALLAWLAALGCPVILLSATLGSRWRRELIEAYTGMEPPEAIPYPAVIRAETGRGCAVYEVPPEKLPEPRLASLTLEYSNEDDRVKAMALKALSLSRRDRGCVACVCNTVRRAQELYEAVAAIEPGCPVTLFHSRFTRDDRRSREGLLKERFGPDGDRPTRAIVIATQVIEQSLDLDFDSLLTELAPIDLLLQRLGRVLRHSRGRPEERTPELHIYAPMSIGERRFGDSGLVYEPIVLERTLAALEALSGPLTIPDDVPGIIDKVYDFDDEELVGKGVANVERWKNDAAGKAMAELFAALNATIPTPELVTEAWSNIENVGLEDDTDTVLGTRLGRLSIDIAVLGEAPIAPNGTEALARAMGLVVRIASDRLYERLAGRLDTSPWKDSGPLRRVVPLRFQDGRWSDGEWTLEYDDRLGLRFGKGGNAYEA